MIKSQDELVIAWRKLVPICGKLEVVWSMTIGKLTERVALSSRYQLVKIDSVWASQCPSEIWDISYGFHIMSFCSLRRWFLILNSSFHILYVYFFTIVMVCADLLWTMYNWSFSTINLLKYQGDGTYSRVRPMQWWHCAHWILVGIQYKERNGGESWTTLSGKQGLVGSIACLRVHSSLFSLAIQILNSQPARTRRSIYQIAQIKISLFIQGS